jgi:hypothetical protein
VQVCYRYCASIYFQKILFHAGDKRVINGIIPNGSNQSTIHINGKGVESMSIERFILRKLSRCREKELRENLLQLLVIRIQKAQERTALESARKTAV